MTGRERELAVIRHEVPDRIPVDTICVENIPAIAAMLNIRPDQVPDVLGLDGRIVGPGYGEPYVPGKFGPGILVPNLLPGVDATAVLDEWGTPLAYTEASTSHNPLRGIDSLSALDRYAWPDVNLYDYTETARYARELSPRYAVRGPYFKPIFSRICGMVGMEDAMILMKTEPAIFEGILDRITEILYEDCRRMIDACGDAMPIFCIGDDFATQRGLMIDPGDWRRFLKPRWAKIFDMAKRRGKYVWFHSCGNVLPVLGDLIDIGVDLWETVQLQTLGISPKELKREYGRHVAFFGGINSQRLAFTTPEAVRREVQETIQVLGEGGGYICGADHHVKYNVPAENALALFKTATQFRGKGITLDAA